MADLGRVMSLIAIPVLLGAALSDIASRRVPNWHSALIAAVGIAARVIAGDLLSSLLLTAFTFAILFGCWTRGWLGGGDVKLLAASALLVPVSTVATLFLTVALFGGLLAVFYLVGRVVGRKHVAGQSVPGSAFQRVRRIEAWRIRRGAPLPYACAIAAGCIFTIVTG